MNLKTPYYLIDEKRLLRNLKLIKRVREISGAKSVLALKCFSTWSVFGLMSKFMDGTTSSSLFEARLGYEKFGKEVHAYSVAFSPEQVKQVSRFADKIIFNSLSQLRGLEKFARNIELGLRINPLISYSHFDLADPARKYSRLGVVQKRSLQEVINKLSGIMFHFNCENDDFTDFSKNLDYIGRNYAKILKQLKWVSLGGGLYFTKPGYPVKEFARKLKDFAGEFEVQVYLEPGESAITGSAQLVTKVLDIVKNKKETAIVDASIEAHMLDLLTYRICAKMKKPLNPKYEYIVAGCSCLAGDVFGTFRFSKKLKAGSLIRFEDAAGYTMVKKNWFNGINMPSIAVKRLNGRIELVKEFGYKDFVGSLS